MSHILKSLPLVSISSVLGAHAVFMLGPVFGQWGHQHEPEAVPAECAAMSGFDVHPLLLPVYETSVD